MNERKNGRILSHYLESDGVTAGARALTSAVATSSRVNSTATTMIVVGTATTGSAAHEVSSCATRPTS